MKMLQKQLWLLSLLYLEADLLPDAALHFWADLHRTVTLPCTLCYNTGHYFTALLTIPQHCTVHIVTLYSKYCTLFNNTTYYSLTMHNIPQNCTVHSRTTHYSPQLHTFRKNCTLFHTTTNFSTALHTITQHYTLFKSHVHYYTSLWFTTLDRLHSDNLRCNRDSGLKAWSGKEW